MKNTLIITFRLICIFVISIMALVFISCASYPVDRQSPMEEVIEKQTQAVDKENRIIVNNLQKGGYILYLRHTKTIWDEKDVEPYDFDDCSKQRNLSDEGREQARAIGEAIEALGIPIGEIQSSPFCRTKETAMLAFGRFSVSNNLVKPPKEDLERREYLMNVIFEVLSEVPPPNQNTVLVSHTTNLSEFFDFKPYPEGSLIVFKPDGNGSFRQIRIIKPDELIRIASK